MLAELLAIQPNAGTPVARTDDEKDPSAAPRIGDRERTRVPADIAAVRYHRERRAPGERHDNFACPRQRAAGPPECHAFIAGIERKAPATVEIEPLGALEVRSWMLGKGDRGSRGDRRDLGGAERQQQPEHGPRLQARARRATAGRRLDCRGLQGLTPHRYQRAARYFLRVAR